MVIFLVDRFWAIRLWGLKMWYLCFFSLQSIIAQNLLIWVKSAEPGTSRSRALTPECPMAQWFPICCLGYYGSNSGSKSLLAGVHWGYLEVRKSIPEPSKGHRSSSCSPQSGPDPINFSHFCKFFKSHKNPSNSSKSGWILDFWHFAESYCLGL